MNTQVARVVARNCWSFASRFQVLNPVVQKVFGEFGDTSYKKPQSWLGSWLMRQCKRAFRWRLDKMILLDDLSVRVMILKAMSIMDYHSRHLGLIAVLYASEESGYLIDHSGEKMSSTEVSDEVWKYFLDLLAVPSYREDLQRRINHWEGVLRIDYTKEFSIEGRWDTSGEKPVYVHRDVPPEEVAVRIAKNKTKVKKLYKYDLKKLFEKKMSGYYEQRPLEVRQCLEEIFAYIFQNELNIWQIGAVLEMLARIVGCGKFPEKWLLELSQKYVTQ